MQAIALWTFADPAALSHGIISWIIVGLIAGWAAGKIMKGSGYGPLTNILLGIVGAIVGGWIVRILGFAPSGDVISSIVTAIIGAVLLIALARAIKKR